MSAIANAKAAIGVTVYIDRDKPMFNIWNARGEDVTLSVDEVWRLKYQLDKALSDIDNASIGTAQ